MGEVMDLPEILLVEDVADLLKIGRPAARALIRKGALGPFAKIGKRLVLRRESVMKTIEDKEEAIDDKEKPRANDPARPEVPVAVAGSSDVREGAGRVGGATGRRLRYHKRGGS